MNKFYLCVVLILSFNFSYCAPVIKSVKDGYWNQASSWDLNRLPQAGDTIIINDGNAITVNNNQNLNGAAFLKVYGKLSFQNNGSTLSFGNNSFIWVLGAGQITGGGSASQKLRLNGVIIFDGSSATVYGPQVASVASNGFASMVTASSPSTLPVKFVGFALTSKNGDVLIQWSTSEEINANKYGIERSFDGTNWSTIASIAAAGNSKSVNNYSYTDRNLCAKIAYYRIKEVDENGQLTLTAIKSIKTDAAATLNNIKIISIQNRVVLEFEQPVGGSVRVRFVSLNGRLADQQTINNPVGQVVLNSKLTGNYIIAISNGQQINTAKQVIL